jgi:hypothetical protein
MTQTWRGSEIASAFVDFLKSDATNIEGLGLQEVYYGDQQQIPVSPAVCVEAGSVERSLEGVPFQTKNTITVAFMVYHAGLGDIQAIQHTADVLTEDLAEELNRFSLPAVGVNASPTGTQVDGLVIYGHTTGIEYGYAVRSNVLMRANRITWEGLTKTHLVQQP